MDFHEIFPGRKYTVTLHKILQQICNFYICKNDYIHHTYTEVDYSVEYPSKLGYY